MEYISTSFFDYGPLRFDFFGHGLPPLTPSPLLRFWLTPKTPGCPFPGLRDEDVLHPPLFFELLFVHFFFSFPLFNTRIFCGEKVLFQIRPHFSPSSPVEFFFFFSLVKVFHLFFADEDLRVPTFVAVMPLSVFS